MDTTITAPSLQSNPSLSTTSIPPDLDAPADSNFKVYVRCRPLTNKELSTENPKKLLNIIRKHENIVCIFSYHLPNFSRCSFWTQTPKLTETPPPLFLKRTDPTLLVMFLMRDALMKWFMPILFQFPPS